MLWAVHRAKAFKSVAGRRRIVLLRLQALYALLQYTTAAGGMHPVPGVVGEGGGQLYPLAPYHPACPQTRWRLRTPIPGCLARLDPLPLGASPA